jgi:glycerol-3-phosphate dehydrogenase (NAD(P)+)
MVAEGVRTTRSAHALALKMRVEMPLTDAVHQVLFEDLPAREAIETLMARNAKAE